jgi:hypothetical protein
MTRHGMHTCDDLTYYCRKYMFHLHEEESGRTDGHRVVECVVGSVPMCSQKLFDMPVFYTHSTERLTQDLVYLDEFYKHAREAISRDAYAELAYACYAIFKYGFSRIILIASCITVSSPVYTLCCF